MYMKTSTELEFFIFFGSFTKGESGPRWTTSVITVCIFFVVQSRKSCSTILDLLEGAGQNESLVGENLLAANRRDSCRENVDYGILGTILTDDSDTSRQHAEDLCSVVDDPIEIEQFRQIIVVLKR
ncbi:hypothetical protein PRIPAC_93951, partial [Pristionchus pacificus]|uniref:Uncharacterized protein n=1 Tax=Pristionchus pacificus TaxID=54126 RepID=A0A2A6BAI3_PRIPA